MSFVRVVRFTDVTAERIDALAARMGQYDAPPEGVVSTGIQVLFDAEQGTAVVVQMFDTEQNMLDSEAVLEAMPADETPGTRASVDRCEVKIEMSA